jgi:type 1 fimbria pilin
MKVLFKPVGGVMLILLVNALSMSLSLAADSTLNVSGNVIASGCVVDNETQKVKIGSFTAKDFPEVGSTSAFKAMNISLSKCYSKLKNVQVKFSGVADSDNPGLLAITDTGSGNVIATGVGVEILDNTMKIIPFNSVVPLVYELDGESNTLSFLLRYKSTKPQVTPGDASAVMNFDLTYQ